MISPPRRVWTRSEILWRNHTVSCGKQQLCTSFFATCSKWWIIELSSNLGFTLGKIGKYWNTTISIETPEFFLQRCFKMNQWIFILNWIGPRYWSVSSNPGTLQGTMLAIFRSVPGVKKYGLLGNRVGKKQNITGLWILHSNRQPTCEFGWSQLTNSLLSMEFPGFLNRW